MTCVAGETIAIAVDYNGFISTRLVTTFEWYVVTDGGDALEGTCVVNGLQERNVYTVVTSSVAALSLAV